MNRRATTMLGLGCMLALTACMDRSQNEGGAEEARSLADAGEEQVQADTRPEGVPGAERPTGMPDAVGGTGMQSGQRDASAMLSMSGGPSPHVVDGAGSAVYVLEGNADGRKCDAACEEAWPPVITSEQRTGAGTGVEAANIGMLQRGDRAHVTYRAQPLYRYAGDAGANRTAGHGVQDQWGTWSLIGPDGSPLPPRQD